MAAAPPPPPPPRDVFRNCWGCRLVCGLGLLGAGGYVFASARSVLRRTASAPSFGTVAQMVFALGLASWGVVVLVNPEQKSQLK
ncbi:distal membrane-arm assembly complex protein 1 [Stegostoma tigrinum]|uniref:distal membrane-arm assembly complex protein 1 n=1 Tax=Stegostoma tigrinum TaxID=3053191 RepID=UPI00286FBA04|nr:distal membrane-arm assembly complex protein 1 [Stegostoma tigrinum]